MNKINSIRGMHDLMGSDFLAKRKIINEFELLANNFNFKPISTPILEFSEVFQKSLGNSSDVVTKEMYTFNDRNQESLTLRPEGTAGIARAVISNGLTQNLPLKLYYYGPMFRYERPQKGRLRQFHQLGIESYSTISLERDFEVIMLAERFLKNLNIIDRVVLQINNLGNSDSRNEYKKILNDYYNQNKKKLSKDSLVRLKKNPLRILDSKNLADIEINRNAPIINEYLSLECKKQFSNFKNMLKNFNISYQENPLLVRGLDYYNNNIFEFTSKNNSKFAVLAGGSYNNLVKQLGGPALPGIGWAAGIERIIEYIKPEKNLAKKIIILPLEEAFLSSAFKIRDTLINASLVSEVYKSKSLKKAMKYANKINATYSIIIGEEEIKSSSYTVKNLLNGKQVLVKQNKILDIINND